MFNTKKTTTGGTGFGGFLAEGTEIEGDVRFADELRIDGSVNGRVMSDRGRLVVGDTGKVTAEITVGTASISGMIRGTLVAAVKVEIHSTGQVFGDIRSPALIIEEGGVFEGNCAMAKSGSVVEALPEKSSVALIAK